MKRKDFARTFKIFEGFRFSSGVSLAVWHHECVCVCFVAVHNIYRLHSYVIPHTFSDRTTLVLIAVVCLMVIADWLRLQQQHQFQYGLPLMLVFLIISAPLNRFLFLVCWRWYFLVFFFVCMLRKWCEQFRKNSIRSIRLLQLSFTRAESSCTTYFIILLFTIMIFVDSFRFGVCVFVFFCCCLVFILHRLNFSVCVCVSWQGIAQPQ